MLRRKWEDTATLNHHLRILAAKPLLAPTRQNRNFPINNKTAARLKELERKSEIEKGNMTLYKKMEAILVNSRESTRIKSNRK